MPTRSEQVTAYRFVTRRIVSALLAGEPETNDLPMRRLGMAFFGSAMVATIVFAGIGVYGLMVPGGSKPKPNEIILERETSARYVYAESNKTLYPVINYASARLILKSADTPIRTMSAASLRKVRRGQPIGIPGAPDSVPARKALLGLPWSVCTADSTRQNRISTVLTVGAVPDGGEQLGDSAVVAKISEGPHASEKYLLWNNVRLRVKDESALVALNLASSEPVSVSESFLNAVPAGPDLAQPFIAEPGKQTNIQLGGKAGKIGQVYKAGEQFYVLLGNGLALIGPVTADLLLRDGSKAESISANEAAQRQVDTKLEAKGFPQRRPAARQGTNTGTRLCGTYTGGEENATTIRVYVKPPTELAATDASAVAAASTGAVAPVDRVVVAGGFGALVRELPAPGVNAETTVYLITDQGIRYPLAAKSDSGDAAAALGYSGVKPTPVPADLLALIPTGPLLDPQAALQPVDSATPTATGSARPAASTGSARPSQAPSSTPPKSPTVASQAPTSTPPKSPTSSKPASG